MAVIQREGSKQIYYEDYGQGSSAVVMIHAWGLSCRAWDSNTRALAQAGFRVVAIDARGCGQSDKDFDTMTLEAVADDVVALVKELKLTDVVLNGWSFGGAVAVIAATKLASRCKGLILTAAATPIYTQKAGLELGSTQEDFEQIVAALAVDRPPCSKTWRRDVSVNTAIQSSSHGSGVYLWIPPPPRPVCWLSSGRWTKERR